MDADNTADAAEMYLELVKTKEILSTLEAELIAECDWQSESPEDEAYQRGISFALDALRNLQEVK